MLTIICGEDSIASRDYFFEIKKKFRDKDYQIIEILPNKIEEILKWQHQSLYLFKPKIVFFVENLIQSYLKKYSKKLKLLENLHQIKDQIFDWENEKSKYELNLPSFLLIKEFRPKATIFSMLDACYPGNLKQFINLLHQLKDLSNENLIFYMLIKHLRNLILIKENQNLNIKNQWQLKKLQNQAKLWSKDRLLNFYDSLYKIDYLIKTSSTPFSLIDLLDIMACYYL